MYYYPICYRILILVLAVYCSGCACLNSKPYDKWLGRDKAYHFTAGFIIGGTSAIVLHNNGMNRASAIATGAGITIPIGAGKEYYDKYLKKTYWSWKDMTWNFAGGLAGSFTAISLAGH